ncbi:endonuclease/exonuclease/phosphatase family protein [Glaciecola sp. 2405UD65-10]|uniref:endonuclease/exonuclease/phosphatase family protein n=1 Tax=Glaciecola sp. 2405UD65-10 TaxID=3397244 RepID=UPI003B5AEC8D
MDKIVFILCTVLSICACSSNNKQTDAGGVAAQTDLLANASSFKHQRAGIKPISYDYANAKRLKIISWNVEHFVDAHDDPYIENDRENNSKHMLKKRADLVSALKTANADIVVLQEFESAKLLRNIATTELAGMGYQFFADAPSPTWYMNVVVMSKVPLGVMYSYGNVHTPLVDWLDDNGNQASQNSLNTRTWAIDVYPSNDYSFVLSAVHLKAGRSERDIAMRLGQINMLKAQFERFLLEDPNRNILMVGDFNSLPNSKEMQALLQGTTLGNTFTDPLASNQYTHPANNPTRRLDYAIMNGNMLAEMVENSAKPVTFFDAAKQDALADHLPVMIEFYLQNRLQ